MKKIACTFCFLFFTVSVFSINPGTWEITSKNDFLNAYKKALEWFTKTEKYGVSVIYSSYMDHQILKPYEKSEGIFLKDGKKAFTKVLSVKTIRNDQFFFSVDTVEKIIVVNNLVEKGSSPIDMQNIETILENVKSIKKQTSLEGSTRYMIEFKPDLMYSSFEFELSKEGLIKKQSFFYDTEMKEENNDVDESGNVNNNSVSGKPRLELTYSNYQSSISSFQSAEFSEKKYFSQTGNKIILSERYKSYLLKDYRYDLKK
jgi:hypothetical protein